jgi:hypothetical protein
LNGVFKSCPIWVQGHLFPADLFELPFEEFDLILGMDWLTTHSAIVDCKLKRLTLQSSDGSEVLVVGETTNYLSNVISAIKAEKLVSKGCSAYLAYILDTRVEGPKLNEVRVVQDFPDVFPEELLGLPPDREVEFGIEVQPGSAPVSIASYRMAPSEYISLGCSRFVCKEEGRYDAVVHRLSTVEQVNGQE